VIVSKFQFSSNSLIKIAEKMTMALRNELRETGDMLFKNRSYLPVFIILIGILVFYYAHQEANPLLVSLTYDILCISIASVGLIIRAISVGFSADNTSGRNTGAGQIANEINTTGLYSCCRHPLYLGNFFMWLGVAMFTANLWFLVAFALFFWVYYERIMYAEEAYLIEKYGAAYEEWASNVPAFIPAFTKWKSPKYHFSIKKVVRQEKSTFLNLCIMIFLFKVLHMYMSKDTAVNFDHYWTWILAFGITWYVIVKLIQKNTTLLSQDRV
jgi:protein-S-isoprenylcysteine O-methyltransferase Ste14